MSKKIVTIVGARPQFVKAAVVSRALQTFNIEEVIVHTGQHFDYGMSEVFFKEMEIPIPKYNLGINSLSHGAMTGRMIEAIEEILLKEKPNMLIVYGDTNSTLSGALAASKIHIPVAHVEAGLRSFNMNMPEEINRILTDRISSYLFCPTDVAVKNLNDEGFSKFTCHIEQVGDVMYDAALYYSQKSKEKSHILAQLGNPESYILATLHRQENTDNLDNLKVITESFNEINNLHQVILPLHPRTRNIIQKNNLKTNYTIIDPVGYFDMLELLGNCSLVMTDSGGLQKEAYFFKKNCVTLREETEWVELVDNGFNVLAHPNKEDIILKTNQMITTTNNFDKELYGDGHAGEIIANYIYSNH